MVKADGQQLEISLEGGCAGIEPAMKKKSVVQLTFIAMLLQWSAVQSIEKRSDDSNPLEVVVNQHSEELQALKASVEALKATVGRYACR